MFSTLSPLLLAILVTTTDTTGVKPAFPVLENREAWRMLPREAPQLPAWARTLAVSQPLTTAGVLALDYLHRAKNPLGLELAAKVRWAIADEMKCEYAKKYAEADLRRITGSATDLEELIAGEVSPTDRVVLKFARKLTSAGYSVTDAEMAAVTRRLGRDRTVALVHTTAFANFHFRIIHALGVKVEEGGPLPPVEVKFDPSQTALGDLPARPAWKTVADLKPKRSYRAPPDWEEFG
jgi:alkylhydroperoxidase family enzyme